MTSLLCIYAFYGGIFLCLSLYAFSSCGGDCDGGLCGGDRDGGNGGGGGDHLYLVGRTLHCIREGLKREIAITTCQAIFMYSIRNQGSQGQSTRTDNL